MSLGAAGRVNQRPMLRYILIQDMGYGYRPLTKWERNGFCPPGQR